MEKSRHQFVIYGSIGIEKLLPFMFEAGKSEIGVSFNMCGVVPSRIGITVYVYGAGIARKDVGVIPLLKAHGGEVTSLALAVYEPRRPFGGQFGTAHYKKVLA